MKIFKLIHNEQSFGQKGYTLIEMLVVITIVSILGIVISKFQRDVFSFNGYFSSSFSTADSAQKLLRPMTAEIRSASPSSSGAYPIDSIGDYSFSFYSDADNDGSKELIKYILSGTTITKETTKPTGNPPVYLAANKVVTTFITGVRNISDGIPVFTYYDGTYTGGAGGVVSPTTGSLNSIRLIGIKIRIDPDQNKSPSTTEVSTQVSIRNLKVQQ
jgi:prepilin-type N-terminal cleavage/methylation domain-containing protein